MASAIDETVPADDVPADKADLRANFLAAKDEIEALQTAVETKADLTRAPNAQVGTTYTLALSDNGGLVTMDNGDPNTVTLPANTTVALPVGFSCDIAWLGVGTTTVEAATDVLMNGVSDGAAAISAQFNVVNVKKLATDTWLLSLQHGAVS